MYEKEGGKGGFIKEANRSVREEKLYFFLFPKPVEILKKGKEITL